MATNSGRPVFYINLLTNTDPMFKTATNSAYTQNEEWHRKKAVTTVKVVYSANPGSIYPYPTMTQANISFEDGKRLFFELQDIDPAIHPTWTNGDQASATAFENDFAAAMPV